MKSEPVGMRENKSRKFFPQYFASGFGENFPWRKFPAIRSITPPALHNMSIRMEATPLNFYSTESRIIMFVNLQSLPSMLPCLLKEGTAMIELCINGVEGSDCND